jgi:hypothetical protein
MRNNTATRLLSFCLLLALVVALSATAAPRPPAAPEIAAPGQGEVYTPQPAPLVCLTYCCAPPTVYCSHIECSRCVRDYNGGLYDTLSACQAVCH